MSWQEIAWWTNWNFLGLLPKYGKDQWDCKIVNCSIEFSLHQWKVLYLYSGIPTFFERTCFKMFSIVLPKVHASSRNLTWFTRLFFSQKDLGRKLIFSTYYVCVEKHWQDCSIAPSSVQTKLMHLNCNYHLLPSVIGSLNGPVPLTLTAATWKTYSEFGVRPSMMSPVVTTELFCCTSLSSAVHLCQHHRLHGTLQYSQ